MTRQHTLLAGGIVLSALLHGALLGLLSKRPPTPAFAAGLPVLTASLAPVTASADGHRERAKPPEPPPTKIPRPAPHSSPAPPPRTTRVTRPAPAPSSTRVAQRRVESTARLVRNATPPPAPRPVANQETRHEQSASTLAPANAAPSTNTVPRPGEQLHNRIQHYLAANLRERFRYPLLARRRGWQGVVRLRFLVRPNGEIADVQLAASSGFHALDRDALKTAQQLRQLPQRLVWQGGATLTLELPVRYRLNG